MSWATLTSITAYRSEEISSTFDISLTPACRLRVPLPFPPFAAIVPLPVVNILSSDKAFSQELQLLSPESSRLTWVTGLYYFHDIEDLESTFSRVVTNSYAGFGEAHIEFLPATHLTLGLRYTDEDKGTVGQLRILQPA